MTTSAAEYRYKAEEAATLSIESLDPFVSKMNEKISHHWRELASHVERNLILADAAAPPVAAKSEQTNVMDAAIEAGVHELV